VGRIFFLPNDVLEEFIWEKHASRMFWVYIGIHPCADEVINGSECNGEIAEFTPCGSFY
jgi:hypothetical protein